MSEKISIIDYVNILVEKTKVNKDDDFYQQFQPYIVIRFLSMDRRFLTNILQIDKFTFHFYKVEHKPILFELIDSVIPKSKNQFVKYIKKQKQEKYPEEVYIILKKIYGEFYSKKELEWIVDTLISKNEVLRNELKIYLINSGFNHNELVKYFPELFKKDDFEKVNDSIIKNEIKQIINLKKKQEEQKKKDYIDNLL